jgi:hypothetical protein
MASSWYLPGPARHVAESLAFFAIKFAPPQPFFSALAILYVDAGSVPLDNLSLLVAKRDFVAHHPAIFAVGAQEARFMQEGFARGQRPAPFFHDSFDVIGDE